MIIKMGSFSIILLLCVASLVQGNIFHKSKHSSIGGGSSSNSSSSGRGSRVDSGVDSGSGGGTGAAVTEESAGKSQSHEPVKSNGVDFNSWISGRDSATNQSYFRSGSVYDSEVSGAVK
jgi:hypothetical protein